MKTPSRKTQARKKKPRGKKTAFGMIRRDPPVEFPEVKGKTIAALKLFLREDDTSISLTFFDKTHLQFDLEPGLTVRTDLSDWKTHNWRPIKSWPPYQRASSWAED